MPQAHQCEAEAAACAPVEEASEPDRDTRGGGSFQGSGACTGRRWARQPMTRHTVHTAIATSAAASFAMLAQVASM